MATGHRGIHSTQLIHKGGFARKVGKEKKERDIGRSRGRVREQGGEEKVGKGDLKVKERVVASHSRNSNEKR